METKGKTPILSIEHVYKKFCTDIRYNMIYGMVDLVRFNQSTGQLRKREFWALDDINIDLFSGEIVGVVGANGSGKTTLMRMISQIYPINKGAIYVKPGLKITAIFALRTGMQQLFTGRENIYIKGAMYGMTKEEIDAKMEFISDFSELGDKLDRPFGNYSSGMKARLAYSIALATDPNIFIVDEALAVGDSVFKAKCFDNLKSFVQQPDKSVLFVSNNIKKVLKIATRIVVMDFGKIIHQTDDIQEGLLFYVRNCLRDLDEDQIELRLNRVTDYDM
ncbi:MAG: ABC transporter ATP-binding protein [Saprospiraceae bacterium]|nr:ABC transporter ATP-binding protein [Saprospiraceae bacterium]